MDKVWLTCPKCKQSFEIDVGFAGSVCRCLLCGALVSVPLDHSFERPKPTRSAAPKGARFKPQLGPAPPPQQAEPTEPDELPEATIADPPPAENPHHHHPETQPHWEQHPDHPASDTTSPADYQAGAYPPDQQQPHPGTPHDPYYGDPPAQPTPPQPPQWGEPHANEAPPSDQYWHTDQAATTPQTPDVAQWTTADPQPPAQPPATQWPDPAQQPPTQPPAQTKSQSPPARARHSTGRHKTAARAKRSRKRKGLRTGIVGGFILIVALMVILLALAVKNSIDTAEPASADDGTATTTTNTDDEATQEDQTDDPAADSEIGPQSLRQAEMLAIPTSETAVLILDAGSASGAWLPMIKDAILADTIAQPDGNKVQIVLAAEDGTQSHPDQPTESDNINRDDCERFMRGVMALGDPDLPAAIQSALAQKPAQIILVTGRDVTVEQTRSISQLIAQAPGARLDVLAIGTQASRLASLARRNGGEYQQQSLEEFQAWYEQQP